VLYHPDKTLEYEREDRKDGGGASKPGDLPHFSGGKEGGNDRGELLREEGDGRMET